MPRLQQQGHQWLSLFSLQHLPFLYHLFSHHYPPPHLPPSMPLAYCPLPLHLESPNLVVSRWVEILVDLHYLSDPCHWGRYHQDQHRWLCRKTAHCWRCIQDHSAVVRWWLSFHGTHVCLIFHGVFDLHRRNSLHLMSWCWSTARYKMENKML